MTRKSLGLGWLLCSALLLAKGLAAVPVPFLQDDSARLDGVFSQGRKVFYRELRLLFGLSPERFRLIPSDAQRIMEAEREIAFLYERVINLVYVPTERDLGRLLRESDVRSLEEFEKRFLALCREAAGLVVQSLFEEPAGTVPRPGVSRLHLVLSSLGAAPDGPGRPRADSGRPSGLDASGFWGLKIIRAGSAGEVSRGKGIRVVVLDSTPRAGTLPLPMIPLGGEPGAPWLESTSPDDRSNPAETWVSSLVEAVAPESETRVFRIVPGLSPAVAFWTAYRVGCGIRRAVDSGANIVLVTAVFDRDFGFLKDACDYAYTNNVVVICPNSSGFSGPSDPEKPAHFPAHYNTTVAVGGVVPDGRGFPVIWEKAEASHYTTCAAPTAVGGFQNPGRPGRLAPDNSPAAALVAGTAALICSLLPKTGEELSGQYVQRIYKVLCRSCDIGRLGRRGFDARAGYGLIDADRAVRREVPAYREEMSRVEARFKKRMEERAAEKQNKESERR